MPREEAREEARVRAKTIVTVVVMAEMVAVIGVVDVVLQADAGTTDGALRAGVRGGIAVIADDAIVVIAEGAGDHPLGEEAVLEAEEIETEAETEIVIETGVEIVTEGEMVAGTGVAADGDLP